MPGPVEREAVDGVCSAGFRAVVVVDAELVFRAIEQEAATADSPGPGRHRKRAPQHRVRSVVGRHVDQQRLTGNDDLPDSSTGVGVHRHPHVAGAEVQSRIGIGHRAILHPMRAVVQRVIRAEVTSRAAPDADWDVAGSIGPGLCVLVGATHSDTPAEADKLADKLLGLRIFDDTDGVMNRSVADVGGSLLVVSQFTLYGDTAKGRRPSWIAAARPEVAEPLVERVVERLRAAGVPVETGRFRTDMRVELVNDGPVTLMLDVD